MGYISAGAAVLGLEVIVVPALVWHLSPASWHPGERVIYAIGGFLIAVALAVTYLRGTAARRASVAGHITWRWSPGTKAQDFRLGLEQYLRGCGWQVDSATVGKRNRVEVIARKDRWCLAMLCVGPGPNMVSLNDMDRLSAMREKAGATHALIVAPDQGGPTGMSASGGSPMRLLYRDLPSLDTALGRRFG